MKKLKRVIRNLICLFLLYIVFGAFVTIIIIDDARKPVVYKSASRLEIVRVEIHGQPVPPEEIKGRRRYHLIRVE